MVTLLAARVPGLVTILPAVAHVADKVRAGAADWPTPLHIVEGEDDKFAAFDAADVALAASGTVTAELALAKTPMVVAYKVAPLTYRIVTWFKLMRTTRYSLPNVLAGRDLVPEILQHACTPQALADALLALYADSAGRVALVAEFERLHRELRGPAEQAAAAAVAALLAPAAD